MNATERIKKARMGLILDEPFFGMLLMNLELLEDPRLDPPTMCTNGERLTFHPEFTLSLSDPELKYVLTHEVMHCGLRHTFRRGSREPRKWNVACDFAVNNFIAEYLDSNPAANMAMLEGVLLNSAWSHLCAEEIYAALPTPTAGSGSSSEANGGRGSEGGQDDSSPKGNGDGPPGPGDIGRVEDSPGSEAERARTEESWRARFTEAAMTAHAHGKLPSSLRRLIEQVLRPDLPWTDILRNFIRARAKDDYSWRRPNKKMMGGASGGLVLPSLHSERMGTVVVAVDTSGSIHDEMLQRFLSEAQGILDECRPEKLILLDCDAAVHGVREFEPGDDDLAGVAFNGGGGTDFRPVFNWIEENDVDPVGVVYLTDLCGTFPETPPPWDTLWVVYGESHKHPPFGERVCVK